MIGVMELEKSAFGNRKSNNGIEAKIINGYKN